MIKRSKKAPNNSDDVSDAYKMNKDSPFTV